MSTTTEAATAATSTRTRTRGRNRAEYRVAGAAMREARARFSEARAGGQIKCKASAEVLLTLLAEIGGYSRTNDTMSVRQIESLTGISRGTVQRALEELERVGCISLVRVERGRRGLIALPVVEPPEAPVEEIEELAEEEIEELVLARQVSHGEPVGVPPIGNGTHRGDCTREEKEVCANSENALSRARGRSADADLALLAGDHTGIEIEEMHPPPPAFTEKYGTATLPRVDVVIAERQEPLPDPSREAERRAIAAEIERRKAMKEVTA